MKKTEYGFMDPAPRYRGMDLYMVNDALDDEELRRQIREFGEKGIGSVIFRTYNGLLSDYPGEKFRHSLWVAVKAARDAGVRIALQAGYMPAGIPDLDPALALHHIRPVRKDPEAPAERVLCRHGGTLYLDEIVPEEINLLDPKAAAWYAGWAYRDMWREFAPEFGKTITALWVDEPRFRGDFILWNDDFETLFRERYGHGAKKELWRLFEARGDNAAFRYEYYSLIRDRLAECYYTPVRQTCREMGLCFAGHLMGEELLETSISQSGGTLPFYEYFDLPGVDMLRAEHAWYDIPKGPTAPSPSGATVEVSRRMAALGCASVSEQLGKDGTLCEMYGVTSPGFTFRDAMHMFDFFASMGVNAQCMHALFYSPRGFRKRFYPQHFNVYQPFWENVKGLKDYVARVSAFCSEGSVQKSVLVVHPLETGFMLMRGVGADGASDLPRRQIRAYDKDFFRTVKRLEREGIPFHFGDATVICRHGAVAGGKFKVGQMAYDAVVLPRLGTLTKDLFEKLKAFAGGGGKVVVLGSLPTRLEGRADPAMTEALRCLPGIRVVPDAKALVQTLREIPAEAGFCPRSCGDATLRVARNEDGYRFFLSNGDCAHGARGYLYAVGDFEALSYDPCSNTLSPLPVCREGGKTLAQVTLPEGGMAAVLFRRSAPALSAEPTAARPKVLPVALSVEPPEENLLTLEYCLCRAGGELVFPEPMPVEVVAQELKRRAYVGDLTLTFAFEAKAPMKDLRLVCEDPEKCALTLDGESLGAAPTGYYLAPAFQTLDLPPVGAGRHEIGIARMGRFLPREGDMSKRLLELFRAPAGDDVERIHLCGRFVVETTPCRVEKGLDVFGEDFALAPPEGARPPCGEDVTREGCPFLPTPLDYTAAFTLPKDARHPILRIGRYRGCSLTVTVNGKKAGQIDREPYTLSLEGLAKAGQNTLRLRLLGTWRNMMGPSHVKDFEVCTCSPASWQIPVRDAKGNDLFTRDYRLTPFGISDVSIIYQ